MKKSELKQLITEIILAEGKSNPDSNDIYNATNRIKSGIEVLTNAANQYDKKSLSKIKSLTKLVDELDKSLTTAFKNL